MFEEAAAGKEYRKGLRRWLAQGWTEPGEAPRALLQECFNLARLLAQEPALGAWGRRELGGILQKMENLVQKSRGRGMTIGVMGAPACGKSSFANAFIGSRVIPDKLLEARLSAPLFLRYSPDFGVRAELADGKALERGFSDQAGLKAFLKSLFGGPEGAKPRLLRARGPFPFLPERFTLIDLPSLGGPESRELAAFCDALLVLGHISLPLGLSLINEVKALRGPAAEGCVFTVCACDLLKERDLQRMRLYYSARLKESFGRVPPFYFTSALAALEDGDYGVYNKKAFENFRSDISRALISASEGLILASCLREGGYLAGAVRSALQSLLERGREGREALAEYDGLFGELSFRIGSLGRLAQKI